MRTLESARSQYPKPSEDTGMTGLRGLLSRMGLRGTVSDGDFHLLLVTEVTRMNGGFYCVATWDVYEERIIRPLTLGRGYWAFADEQSRWRPGFLLEVAGLRESTGNLPHRRENLILCKHPEILERWEEPELYSAIIAQACSSIYAQFGTALIENKYIPEGMDCPSLGSVLTRRDRVGFIDDGRGKLRLRFRDNDEQAYTLPVTCDSLQHMFSPKDGIFEVAEANEWLQVNEPDTEIILRLGFCRGYTGSDRKWSPPRCYLQLNGIICPKDSYFIFAGPPGAA